VKILRTFIAIELPTEIRQYLFQSGQRMMAETPPKAVRWVASENMHLTLRFLGDTPADKLPAISAELEAIANQFPPFSLHLDQLDGFPNQKRPRVISVSLAGETMPLQTIQSQIERAVQTLGWKREKRPFRPHLTLGRVKDQNQAHRLSWNQTLERNEFVVSAVNLIESQLRPGGPVYTIRHRSALGF
jgi:2'-5' RNA ligase